MNGETRFALCSAESSGSEAELKIHDFRSIAEAHRWSPRAHAAGDVHVRVPLFQVSPAYLVDGIRNEVKRPDLAMVRVP